MTARIDQYVNLLTTEQHAAYNQERSTADILFLAQDSIQHAETQKIILVDL